MNRGYDRAYENHPSYGDIVECRSAVEGNTQLEAVGRFSSLAREVREPRARATVPVSKSGFADEK